MEKDGHGKSLRERLTGADRVLEYLLMSMRLSEGMDIARYTALAGKPPAPEAVARLEEMGMITRDAAHIRATRAGRPVLNAILRELAE